MLNLFCILNKVIVNEDLLIDENLGILKHPINMEEFNGMPIAKLMGTAYFSMFSKGPVILETFNLKGNFNYRHQIVSSLGNFQNILMSLWMVKDNSVNLDDMICYDTKNQNFFVERNMILYSNSAGEYKNIYLSRNDIKETLIWLDKMKTNIPPFKEEIEDYSGGGKQLNNNNKLIPYYSFNRLVRALRFISLSRAESFLPAKITFYISALESLLSNSTNELRMQVADRTARILGKTYNEKVGIVKTVNVAYEFRSNYIHGAVKTKKGLKDSLKPYKTLEELSSDVDDILRRLLKRFLTDLNYVIQMDEENFSVWIKELLYT